MEDKLDLKICLCNTLIEIYMGPICVPEAGEVEAGEGHCWKIGKILKILPDTPTLIKAIPALEEVENSGDLHVVTRNHQIIVANLNNSVRSFNEKQESLALAIKPVGVHTIKLKYLR